MDDYFYPAQICRRCGNLGRYHKPRVLFSKQVIYKIHKAENALPHIKSLLQVYRWKETNSALSALGTILLRMASWPTVGDSPQSRWISEESICLQKRAAKVKYFYHDLHCFKRISSFPLLSHGKWTRGKMLQIFLQALACEPSMLLSQPLRQLLVKDYSSSGWAGEKDLTFASAISVQSLVQ